jgi:hypothetical protein
MEIEGAVEALTIIEGFDVIEDGGPGVGMGGEIAAISVVAKVRALRSLALLEVEWVISRRESGFRP